MTFGTLGVLPLPEEQEVAFASEVLVARFMINPNFDLTVIV